MNCLVGLVVCCQLASAPAEAAAPAGEPAPAGAAARRPSVRRAATSVAPAEVDAADSPAAAAPAPGASRPSGTSSETPAWLAEGAPSATRPPLDLPKLALRMFVATIGVLATAATSIYLGRQWMDRRRPPAPSDRNLRVLETKSLSPKASLQLVDAAGQLVLVGLDAQGIRTMVPLSSSWSDAWHTAEAAVGDPPTTEPQSTAVASTPSSSLERYRGRHHA